MPPAPSGKPCPRRHFQSACRVTPNARTKSAVATLGVVGSAIVGARRGPDIMQPLDQSAGRVRRSEEHTSELQSLMRISYAVFCLKKKKQKNTKTTKKKKT